MTRTYTGWSGYDRRHHAARVWQIFGALVCVLIAYEKGRSDYAWENVRDD